jgi:hypothetical protein
MTKPLPPFQDGDRVELAPHLDRWMMGDRFGVVVRTNGNIVTVLLDRSKRRMKFHRDDLTPVESP